MEELKANMIRSANEYKMTQPSSSGTLSVVGFFNCQASFELMCFFNQAQ